MREYINLWKRGLTFSGFSSLRDFWMPFLINMVIAMSAYSLTNMFHKLDMPFTSIVISIILLFYLFSVMIPMIALQIRRLHDINLSGLWILIGLIPLGIIALLILNCIKGSHT